MIGLCKKKIRKTIKIKGNFELYKSIVNRQEGNGLKIP